MLYESISKNWRTDLIDEYDLKIDEQVNQFLTFKYNLTYFVITAAVGTLGFTLNFVITNKLVSSSNIFHIILMTAVCLVALSSAYYSIKALRYNMKSFHLHLGYRNRRKAFSQLNAAEVAEVKRINTTAENASRLSLKLLIIAVVFQLAMVIFLFVQKGDTQMSFHYGEDSTKITALQNMFLVEFTNKETKQTIIMQIPKTGVKHQADSNITENEVQDIANQVAHIIRQKLD